jgi:hypothetical protein
MPKGLTKRPTVLGVPVGREHVDWVRLGKLGAAGIGALATAVGGVGAQRTGSSDDDGADEGDELERDDPVDEDDGSDEGGGATPREPLKKLRLIIKEGIDVGVPLTTAYNQWTQFADLPLFMKGPQTVDQEEDDETRWVVKIGPSRRRWTARIVEQTPDERIVWESIDGTENHGAVTFHRLDHNLTRVHVEMEYFPHGLVEKVGNVFLMARRRVRKDLRLYRHFLELNGEETGEWRGEIADGEIDADPDADEERDDDRRAARSA